MVKYFLSFFSMLLLLFFCGCGNETDEPKLVMVTHAEFAPYEEIVDGKIDGIDPAIVRIIADRLGYKLEIQDMDFNAVIAAVQSGKADIAAAGITVTEERKKRINFTNSYVSAAQVVIVRHNSDITDPGQLKGRIIGVQQGTTGDTFVTKNLQEPERYKHAPMVIQALLDGKIDAVVIDSEPAMIFIRQNHALKQLNKPLTSEEYAFAIGKHNPGLLRDFNAELMKMKTSGELDDIIKYYREKHEQKSAGVKAKDEGSLADRLSESIYTNFFKDKRYKYLLRGLVVTLEITVLAVLMGIVIGFVIAIIRSAADQTGHLKILDWLCKIYLTVIRGTPVVVQLLIIYFVIFSSINVDKVLVAVIAFGINSGAYIAEIIRGGIMSIDGGQMEAGRSLGLSYIQSMRCIVLPQALKNVLPALGNEFIVLLKETSIAGYIALQDLTKGGDIIRSQTYDAFLPLIAVALIYLVMVMFLSWLLGRLEKRLKRNE